MKKVIGLRELSNSETKLIYSAAKERSPALAPGLLVLLLFLSFETISHKYFGRTQLRSTAERTHEPYMILDPQSEILHSSTSLQVVPG